MLILYGGGAGMTSEDKTPKIRQFVVSDKMIANEDLNAILAPVDFAADIYHGLGVYLKSMSGFTSEQVFLYAVNWYGYEVVNGGHNQFFTNSTGVVAANALAGLDAMGCLDAAAILEEAIRRLGGSAPSDRDLRCEIIEDKDISFDDLDDRFDDAAVWDAMYAYPKAHPKAFRFEGSVTAPLWKRD